MEIVIKKELKERLDKIMDEIGIAGNMTYDIKPDYIDVYTLGSRVPTLQVNYVLTIKCYIPDSLIEVV